MVIYFGLSFRMKEVSFLKAESYCLIVESRLSDSVNITLIGSMFSRRIAANFRKSIKLAFSLAKMKLIQSWFVLVGTEWALGSEGV